MANILTLLPQLEGDEFAFVQGIIKDMTDTQAQQFAIVYGARRKDPQTILLTTLVGFVGIGGVQRFILGQVGMGILYLLTGGLCFIGTLVDLINHRSLTFEYNWKIANQIAPMVKGMS